MNNALTIQENISSDCVIYYYRHIVVSRKKGEEIGSTQVGYFCDHKTKSIKDIAIITHSDNIKKALVRNGINFKEFIGWLTAQISIQNVPSRLHPQEEQINENIDYFTRYRHDRYDIFKLTIKDALISLLSQKCSSDSKKYIDFLHEINNKGNISFEDSVDNLAEKMIKEFF